MERVETQFTSAKQAVEYYASIEKKSFDIKNEKLSYERKFQAMTETISELLQASRQNILDQKKFEEFKMHRHYENNESATKAFWVSIGALVIALISLIGQFVLR